VFTRNDEFCGFMTTITRADLTLVGYFAMMPALRGQGNGSAALQLMRGMMPQQRIALEIEVLDPQAANYSERVRRRDFYVRNGYRMTSIQYRTYGVPFVVMVNGADISAEEYHQFYDPLVKS
jgi:GNAT superfamily N-acetyltransferase